jgi:signal transduction histidine kinase
MLGDVLREIGASATEPPPAATWQRLVARLGSVFDAAAREREALTRASAAVATAEAANSAKNLFVANLAHELRTPLSNVLGLAELMELERDPLTERQREWLRGIVSSSRHLMTLMDDLRDLGKIERGEYTVQLQSIPIHDAILDGMAAIVPLANARGVLLEPATIVAVSNVRADRVRLRQILYNLIANAVKFTERGGLVRVRARQDDDRVAIAVIDSGVGIAPADLARLYRPFVQLAGRSNDQPEGTGLGLALAKQLIELQGGTIDVASVLGAGTTFTVRIPAG